MSSFLASQAPQSPPSSLSSSSVVSPSASSASIRLSHFGTSFDCVAPLPLTFSSLTSAVLLHLSNSNSHTATNPTPSTNLKSSSTSDSNRISSSNPTSVSNRSNFLYQYFDEDGDKITCTSSAELQLAWDEMGERLHLIVKEKAKGKVDTQGKGDNTKIEPRAASAAASESKDQLQVNEGANGVNSSDCEIFPRSPSGSISSCSSRGSLSVCEDDLDSSFVLIEHRTQQNSEPDKEDKENSEPQTSRAMAKEEEKQTEKDKAPVQLETSQEQPQAISADEEVAVDQSDVTAAVPFAQLEPTSEEEIQVQANKMKFEPLASESVVPTTDKLKKQVDEAALEDFPASSLAEKVASDDVEALEAEYEADPLCLSPLPEERLSIPSSISSLSFSEFYSIDANQVVAAISSSAFDKKEQEEEDVGAGAVAVESEEDEGKHGDRYLDELRLLEESERFQRRVFLEWKKMSVENQNRSHIFLFSPSLPCLSDYLTTPYLSLLTLLALLPSWFSYHFQLLNHVVGSVRKNDPLIWIATIFGLLMSGSAVGYHLSSPPHPPASVPDAVSTLSTASITSSSLSASPPPSTSPSPSIVPSSVADSSPILHLDHIDGAVFDVKDASELDQYQILTEYLIMEQTKQQQQQRVEEEALLAKYSATMEILNQLVDEYQTKIQRLIEKRYQYQLRNEQQHTVTVDGEEEAPYQIYSKLGNPDQQTVEKSESTENEPISTLTSEETQEEGGLMEESFAQDEVEEEEDEDSQPNAERNGWTKKWKERKEKRKEKQRQNREHRRERRRLRKWERRQRRSRYQQKQQHEDQDAEARYQQDYLEQGQFSEQRQQQRQETKQQQQQKEDQQQSTKPSKKSTFIKAASLLSDTSDAFARSFSRLSSSASSLLSSTLPPSFLSSSAHSFASTIMDGAEEKMRGAKDLIQEIGEEVTEKAQKMKENMGRKAKEMGREWGRKGRKIGEEMGKMGQKGKEALQSIFRW